MGFWDGQNRENGIYFECKKRFTGLLLALDPFLTFFRICDSDLSGDTGCYNFINVK